MLSIAALTVVAQTSVQVLYDGAATWAEPVNVRWGPTPASATRNYGSSPLIASSTVRPWFSAAAASMALDAAITTPCARVIKSPPA